MYEEHRLRDKNLTRIAIELKKAPLDHRSQMGLHYMVPQTARSWGDLKKPEVLWSLR